MEEVIYTDGKKYKTVNNNGILTVYRNEELWMDKELIGNKYVLSLVQRVYELEQEKTNLKEEIRRSGRLQNSLEDRILNI